MILNTGPLWGNCIENTTLMVKCDSKKNVKSKLVKVQKSLSKKCDSKKNNNVQNSLSKKCDSKKNNKV